MDRGDEWENSQCVDVWLHRYGTIKQSPLGIGEICQICGDEQYFATTETGKFDNLNYLSYNLRRALTKSHPLFIHEYGNI